MKQYKAVIFDLDGVLCHTDHYHYQAWKKIADKLNIYFDEEINNKLRGISRAESFDIILEKYYGNMPEEEKRKYIQEKNEIYKELLQEMSKEDLSPEVEDMLNKLQRRKIKLAIGSSSKNAGFILEKLGIKHYFDVISDGNNISESKPSPEVFLKAAASLNVQPEACLVVEDAEAGIKAAAAGGMDSAAVGDALKSDLAVYKLESVAEICELLNCPNVKSM